MWSNSGRLSESQVLTCKHFQFIISLSPTAGEGGPLLILELRGLGTHARSHSWKMVALEWNPVWLPHLGLTIRPLELRAGGSGQRRIAVWVPMILISIHDGE